MGLSYPARVDDDLRRLRDSCHRWLTGHGPGSAAELLATIDPDTVTDRYGEGGVVRDLEVQVASLLGLPAAVYLPSGTMAQQAVLRVHAERHGRRTVLFHPMCHLQQHEGQALERLHGLLGRPVGDRHRLLQLADLEAVAEPPAALVLELPQRDLGGQLPGWEDLQAQAAWARERGAATHLDGARLWEASAGYGRSPAEIAGLFDTAYVSFYKGIGALAGCCVAGPEDVVAEVREWRRRMGGTLFGLWPGAASAHSLLAPRLERMPAYLEHARAIAAAVADVEGITVVPDPPQTPMLHLLLRATPEHVAAVARELAREGTWTWPAAMRTTDPGVSRVELSIGEATCALPAQEVRDLLGRFVPSA
jgi:threonine aldolase